MQRLLILIAGLLLSLSVLAESITHGDYTIHYTTFPSTIIPAEVAALHNIKRASNRIVVNISTRLDDKPVRVDVTGSVTNLLEQTTVLDFIEVNERDAVYYLAHHLALEQDLLRFHVIVSLPDAAPVEINILRRYD